MRGAEKQPLSVCNYAIMTQVASDVRRDKIDPYTRRKALNMDF